MSEEQEGERGEDVVADAGADADFEALLEFLKESRGFDFTGYKRSSVRRRVDRRMQHVDVSGYVDYLDRLQVDQDEFTHLFNTILINVTGFFRDQDAWRELQNQVIPQLLAPKTRGEAIRIWSAGCASGEEAYGLAILLAEALDDVTEFRQRVKVYATDVDEDALATARAATYTEKELQAVPADWRERYFERTGSRYSFRSDLRRNVIFGRNDLVQDAPIGRLDLLVCRNTLMYLNAETQAQVLTRFHFALNTAGVLFLGKAEMLLSHARLFLPIDFKRRFFRKADQVTGTRFTSAPRSLEAVAEEPDPAIEDETLLFSPLATVVVTADELVAKANQRAEVQLGVSSREIGRRFTELDLCHRITGLRGSFEDVRRNRTSVWQHEAQFARSATETLYFDIQVVPLDARGEDGVAVALFFTDVTRHQRLTGELQAAHRQVESAYEELQSTVEELETTNEELQSTVEELETTNEELQSTVEELETTNEELQSTNDELQSMNDELRERTGQLDEANDFLESVLGSLRTAVVVVDTELIVRAWNDRAENLWGLRPEEAIGQHLLNLDIGLSTEQLRPPVREAIAGRVPEEPLRVDAINRKGRGVSLAISASPLTLRESGPTGAIVLMDQLDAAVP